MLFYEFEKTNIIRNGGRTCHTIWFDFFFLEKKREPPDFINIENI